MTIDLLLKEAVAGLRVQGGDKLDAEVLLARLLGRERVYLHIHGDEDLEEDVCSRYRSLVSRLAAGEPLHYLIGGKEWMGLEFILDENVLIPREDTRILLERILALKERFTAPVLVEIGTGSGILPVLIRKEWPEAEVHATEIDEKTLAVARENIRRHQADVHTYHCDFLDSIREEGVRADILFSNPPYISEEEYRELDPTVRREPYGALVGGEDGLACYRRLAEEYSDVLKEGGFLLVEIGWKQGAAVRRIFEEAGLQFVATVPDDAGRDRVVIVENRMK